MGNMDTNSEAYKSGEFDEVFEAADTGMMAADDFERYSESVEALREHEAAVEYAANKARTEGQAEGWAEGISQGRAEGISQGRVETIIKVIHNMMKFGMPKEQIAAINNMTVAEIDGLLGAS